MKKFVSMLGLAVVVLSTSCQKDLKVDNETMATNQLKTIRPKDNIEEIKFYALGTGGQLDLYSTSDPDKKLNTATITGLAAGETILSIDFRPATGQLYGVSSNSKVYVINPQTGVARAISNTPFSPALTGSLTGFDFNPTVDRIRVVTSSGQNLRLNPETGMVAAVDGNVSGATISSVAYTNNRAGASTTTLYDIDVNADKLYKQDPPNNGTLVEVGPLRVNLEGEGGFDIAPYEDVALALYQFNKKSALYYINLQTGQATRIEKFKKNDMYYALAIPTAPVAYTVSNNNLIIFSPFDAALMVSKTITGLNAGETIVGIDFRPVNGALYAVGSNSRIYTINASSGAATFVANLSTPLNGTSFGVDFNPVPDRIRIVSNTGQNLRVNPNDGAAVTDGMLNPGMPAVSAAAYTNNFAGTTSTMLFVIDHNNDKLYLQSPPNNGTLMEIGNLGINIEAANGFDIGGTTNNAYGLFTVAGTTKLYRIDLATGKATALTNFNSMVNGFTIGLGF